MNKKYFSKTNYIFLRIPRGYALLPPAPQNKEATRTRGYEATGLEPPLEGSGAAQEATRRDPGDPKNNQNKKNNGFCRFHEKSVVAAMSRPRGPKEGSRVPKKRPKSPPGHPRRGQERPRAAQEAL